MYSYIHIGTQVFRDAQVLRGRYFSFWGSSMYIHMFYVTPWEWAMCFTRVFKRIFKVTTDYWMQVLLWHPGTGTCVSFLIFLHSVVIIWRIMCLGLPLRVPEIWLKRKDFISSTRIHFRFNPRPICPAHYCIYWKSRSIEQARPYVLRSDITVCCGPTLTPSTATASPSWPPTCIFRCPTLPGDSRRLPAPCPPGRCLLLYILLAFKW